MNVLITGASGGIGGAMARAFGKEGHSVAVHYHAGRSEAETICREVADLGGRAMAMKADVGVRDEARALIDGVVRQWGTLDGVVNNAGIARDRSLLRMSEREWRDVVDLNLSGVFWCLQAASERMARAQGGFVINIGSILGHRGGVGCANYVASKAGLIGLTKAAALELGRFNIRVNAVLPGFHLTKISGGLPDLKRERIRSEHALGRTTAMSDLIGLVLRLADTTTVSGQIFNIDSRLI